MFNSIHTKIPKLLHVFPTPNFLLLYKKSTETQVGEADCDNSLKSAL